MIVHSTPLNGAKLLEIEPIKDQRGYFARTYCNNILAEHGIDFKLKQANIAFNEHMLTLRGMHFQRPPYCEEKIVTCYQGSLYDVIIDLNKNSSTFGQWYGVTLSAENQLSLYVPKGFAHGYVTLQARTAIHYMVSEFYTPSHESGIRWNDPAINIEWPQRQNLSISSKDQQWEWFDMEQGGILLKEGTSG